jgi:hypothetical protein
MGGVCGDDCNVLYSTEGPNVAASSHSLFSTQQTSKAISESDVWSLTKSRSFGRDYIGTYNQKLIKLFFLRLRNILFGHLKNGFDGGAASLSIPYAGNKQKHPERLLTLVKSFELSLSQR